MTDKKNTTPDSSDDAKYHAAYIQLRTTLDAIEFMSLVYALKDPKPSTRLKRIKELQKLLMPVLKEIQGKASKVHPNENPREVCPEGFHDCHGCCVPYPCP